MSFHPGTFPQSQGREGSSQESSWPLPPRQPISLEDEKNILESMKSDSEDEESPKRLAFKKLWPYGLLIVLLIALFQVNGREDKISGPATNATYTTLDILVPLVNIAQGEVLDPSLLRVVPIRRSSLSKTQLLQVLVPEDIKNLKAPLIAKKTLPQQRALFWKDLNIRRPPASPVGVSSIQYSTGDTKP
jgi:hypothetical protein